MRKTITLILLLMVVNAVQGAVSLKFNSNGKFKIVQLTDVHYIYNDERSKPAETCINSVLEKEHPDLVILTGDIIFGKPGKESLQTVLNIVSKFKVPFAITFGNHDDEQGVSKADLMKVAMEYPYNLSVPSEGITGVANFVLPILSNDGRRNAEVLYIIDSNSYSRVPGVKGYDYIHFDQIEWYRGQSRRFTSENGGKPLPSMAFFHIPVPEFTEAACSGSAMLYGSRTEPNCSPALNTGFFAAAKEMDDIRAMFVGHDHDNDYAVMWHNILLAYGRYSGGKTVYNNLPVNGARVIELNEGSTDFTTWIRLSNGDVEQRITCPGAFQKK